MVLAVGRLAAQKGFGILLEAAACWRDMRPEPVLVIVGEGPLEAELKSQAARLRLDVRFPGHRDDVPALLASAAVFVLPSVWEGQPLILQEALRAGAPSSPPASAARRNSPARTPPCSFLRVTRPGWPTRFARCSPTRRWPPGYARRPPTARVPCRARTTP